ncbi:MAG: ABC transporter substrate-binding protein [Acidimicrobiia bacterium]
MPPTTRRLPLLPLLLVALLASLLAACGDDDAEVMQDAASAEPASTSESAFPVTIEHALGTAEIEAAPERVVTWGWGSTDAAIALGVVPVAMPHQAYGGDEQGVLPWIRERLEADGAELPTILPDSQEAPIEAIAAARPDLILAPYSGLTQEEYDLLREIAPTVAYPEAAWATPWRDTIELVGEALGRPDDAAQLLADIDAAVAEQAAAHPELDGKTVAMVWPAPDTFYVYKPADARVAFTLDLGLVSAPSVEALEGDATTADTFYYEVSHEQIGALESDILVSYADTQEQADAFLAAPAAQQMAQVRDGRVAQVVGTEFIAAVSPPTALSLTWGLEEYVEILSAVAEAA